MRLATIRTGTGTSAARVEDSRLVLLPFEDLGALIASSPDWVTTAGAESHRTVPLDAAPFAPPVLRPEKVVCVGVNYHSHLEEVGLTAPSYPTLFAKFTRALIGAHDPIQLPVESACVDWEVELGVVLGRPIRNVDEGAAIDAVAGYTIVNDVTMRDWQFRTSQFLQGKSFEASTPVGPFLVTPDEVGNPGELQLTCHVDGTLMQIASTGDMLFSVGEIISYISRFITLAPGDLIATGTPAGVGAARQPPVYLCEGSVLTSAVERLGEQRNVCSVAPVTPGAIAVAG